jgi:hypothetical protein
MLIQLADGLFVNPDAITVIKATDVDTCALFTAGQSAIDGGFHVPYGAAEVAEHINDACAEDGYDDDDELIDDDDDDEKEEDDEEES